MSSTFAYKGASLRSADAATMRAVIIICFLYKVDTETVRE